MRSCSAQRLRAQGGITLAPVGGGFALPHPSTRVTLGRDAGTVALLLLREALPLPEPPPDGVPVTRLFFFIAPSPRAHLDMLAGSAALSRAGRCARLLDEARPDDGSFQALAAADAGRRRRAKRGGQA